MKTVAQLLKLKDQKNQEVHQIKPDHMVLEALMKMAEKNVGALLVVENDEVLGIISERDYARKLVLHGRSSVGTPVRDIMVSPVITVDTHQTVDTCLGIMSDKRLRHLPVVENGKLMGLLSIAGLYWCLTGPGGRDVAVEADRHVITMALTALAFGASPERRTVALLRERGTAE